MRVLVTGAAGFIGYHAAARLLDTGCAVIGIDNLNPYYDVLLKRARLGDLNRRGADFTFHQIDIADMEAMSALAERHADIAAIIHLAAQAGVRYSLENPLAYVEANVAGQVAVLEAARRLPGLKSIVYASSSSVYGNSARQPSAVGDCADQPVSVYAATKRAAELVAESYVRLYGLPCIGLRFFTLYGPWGRPDMAYWLFTEALLAGRAIKVFNHGSMARDFTYIDDAVPAILAATAAARPGEHRIYNIGNSRPERLADFIAVLEQAVGRAAVKEMLPMQSGDVEATYADIAPARRDFGFEPKTPIAVGLPRFVEWYREYHGL